MELANGLTNKFFNTTVNNENKYFVNESNIGKINNYVQILANEIPSGSIVLDVGCAQGKFGAELNGKNCIVYGIEKNEYAAQTAIQSGFYKDVFIKDIENVEVEKIVTKEDISNKVDCIIFCDILEHLVNPTEVLIKFSKILNKNGFMLISIPNISNIDIILHLLKDEFNYTDLGILDNTHLKFFTMKSFAQWIDLINKSFTDVKFDCKYIGNTYYLSDYSSEIEYKYPELFELLINQENYNALQLFLKLEIIDRNEEAIELTNILNHKYYNVIELIGKTLQGKKIEYNDTIISDNETLWINEKFKKINKHLSEALDYINTLKEEVIKKQNNIDEAISYIKKLEAECGSKQNNIDEALTYIKNLETESGNKQNNIDEALTYIKRLEEECGSKQNNIDEALAYIKKLEAECGNKQNNIDEALDYIKQLEFISGIKQINIDKCLADIKHLEDESFYKQAQIDEALQYIGNLEELNGRNSNQINEALDYIRKLEIQNSYYYNKLHESLEANEILKSENEELQEKIETLNNQLNTTYEKIFNMENSTSWKITKPLRKRKH